MSVARFGDHDAEIVVLDRGRELAFSFQEMLRYHGGGSPGGVAHAFKVLERALPLLEPDGTVGFEREDFVFRLSYGQRAVTLKLREGFVSEDFVELARRSSRATDEERRLTEMKNEMAARVMSAAAADVYDVAAPR